MKDKNYQTDPRWNRKSEKLFIKEITFVSKSFPTNNSPKPRYFTGEFKQIFKEKIIPILYDSENASGKLPNSFYKAE